MAVILIIIVYLLVISGMIYSAWYQKKNIVSRKTLIQKNKKTVDDLCKFMNDIHFSDREDDSEQETVRHIRELSDRAEGLYDKINTYAQNISRKPEKQNDREEMFARENVQSAPGTSNTIKTMEEVFREVAEARQQSSARYRMYNAVNHRLEFTADKNAPYILASDGRVLPNRITTFKSTILTDKVYRCNVSFIEAECHIFPCLADLSGNVLKIGEIKS